MYGRVSSAPFSRIRIDAVPNQVNPCGVLSLYQRNSPCPWGFPLGPAQMLSEYAPKENPS